MSITRQSMALLAVESAAIFMSVLLAFFVEEWRDDRREQARMQEAIAAVETELLANRAALAEAYEYHCESIPVANSQMVALVGDGIFPSSPQAANAPLLSTAAYRMSMNSGALQPADAELLIGFSRAYQRIEAVLRTGESLSERNAQIRYNDGEQYLSGFLYYFTSAIYAEEAAIIAIDEVLDHIGRPADDNRDLTCPAAGVD